MHTQIHIPSLSSIAQAARQFLQLTAGRQVFAFYAPLGAGKTTFIKALCLCLGVEDTVQSPSFNIVNHYHIPATNQDVYHFDFYRLTKLSEVFDIGWQDYLQSGFMCLIEWPEIMERLLPPDTVRVHIHEDENHERTLSIEFE